jgi:hypothetical protein
VMGPAPSYYRTGADRNCDDGPDNCGIAVGIACTGDGSNEARVFYEHKVTGVPSGELVTPWSGVTGAPQWGDRIRQYYNGSKFECRYGECGIRLRIELRDPVANTCTVQYSFRMEDRVGFGMDGTWANFQNFDSRDENCDDGPCGMTATLVCN